MVAVDTDNTEVTTCNMLCVFSVRMEWNRDRNRLVLKIALKIEMIRKAASQGELLDCYLSI